MKTSQAIPGVGARELKGLGRSGRVLRRRSESCSATPALAALCLGAAGCNPLWAVSSGPPTTQAEYHYPTDDIQLTQGVALALDCHDVWWGGPCENMTVSSDDPAIARVALVHLDKYKSPAGYVYDAEAQRTVFVVAGVSPGRTKIRVGGDDADEIVDVIVSAR